MCLSVLKVLALKGRAFMQLYIQTAALQQLVLVRVGSHDGTLGWISEYLAALCDAVAITCSSIPGSTKQPHLFGCTVEWVELL